MKKKRSSGFPTRSDTNRAVQSQKMARVRKPIGDISLSGLGRDWTLRRYILHLNDI